MNSKSIATVYAILAAIQEIVKNMGMNILGEKINGKYANTNNDNS